MTELNTLTPNSPLGGGGVYLSDLATGARLEVETEHHLYFVLNAGGGKVWISGHPRYCPTPTEVLVVDPGIGESCTAEAGDAKSCYIGRGMRLEFWHPSHDHVTTSTIRDVRQFG